MTINFSWAKLLAFAKGAWALLRQLSSVAGVVIGVLGSFGLPPEVRAVLVAAGGALLTAEHAATKLRGALASLGTQYAAAAPTSSSSTAPSSGAAAPAPSAPASAAAPSAVKVGP